VAVSIVIISIITINKKGYYIKALHYIQEWGLTLVDLLEVISTMSSSLTWVLYHPHPNANLSIQIPLSANSNNSIINSSKEQQKQDLGPPT
jgi:hypothetical protein